MTPWPPSPATITFVTRPFTAASRRPQRRRPSRTGGCRRAARMQGRRATITESSRRASRSESSRSKPGASDTGSTTSTLATPSGPGQRLDGELPGGLVTQRAPGAGVLLLPGHGGGAVVEHQQDVAGGRRVVDHLDEAAHAGVDEGRVADERHHPAGVRLGQDVAEPEADAQRGAHGHAGVHGLVGRQHAQRVAADVAGDDAVELAEGGVDRVVGAGLAELRRLARGAARARARRRRARMRRTRSTLSSPKRYGRALRLDRDAGGAQRVGEVGVALLDHHAALARAPAKRPDRAPAAAGGGASARGGSPPGAASRAWRAVMPAVTMPSASPPRRSTDQRATSRPRRGWPSSFSRSRRWAGRA